MKFERVSKYPDAVLPVRKTAKSAGYDFTVAEDIVIPAYKNLLNRFPTHYSDSISLELNDNTYLELSVRSSCPLKYWLILANGVGIIDADYYNNPDNEGHIYFQMINLSPFDIQLHKGDVIGQGIIKPYLITEDDNASGDRLGGFGSTSK